MKAIAAVVPELGHEFVSTTVELAAPGADDVIVEIAGVGLCHTDLAVAAGHIPFPFPAVLGHEGSGTVAAVGASVSDLRVGDKVAMSFASCGECSHCVRDRPALCHQFMAQNFAGVRADGTATITMDGAAVGSNFFGQSSFASHAVARRRNVVKLPDDAPLALCGPLGCGIQTGAGAVLNSLDVQPESSLVVTGAGSVGLAAVLAAVVRGAGVIVVVEPHAARRDLALSLGATHAVDPADGALTELVHGIVPDGTDYAVDTTGNPTIIGSLIAALGFGGAIGLIGTPADPTAAVELGLISAQTRSITVRGIVEGDSNPTQFIPYLLDLHRDGRFPFDDLITTVPFSEINRAVALQLSGEAVKVVLVTG